MEAARDDRMGLLGPLLADGRHLLTLGALGILLSGGFALFLSAMGQFLPQDIGYLGMTAKDLCARDGCRIVHFMIHDRVSFGGTLVALGVLYLWLIHFPMRGGERWAWWTMCISVVAGFASFLMYLAHGYMDTWHATATLLLAPVFGGGLWLTRRQVRGTVMGRAGICGRWRGRSRAGWMVLLAVATVMVCAGATICVVGMTAVFVPQDLEYLGTTPAALDALNPRLIPLIAHDRAGFGAGVLNVGFLLVACTWFGRPSRSLWQALAVAGGVGFGCAIGVHPLVGYNNPVHLGPACVGAAGFLVGLAMVGRRMWGRGIEGA